MQKVSSTPCWTVWLKSNKTFSYTRQAYVKHISCFFRLQLTCWIMLGALIKSQCWKKNILNFQDQKYIKKIICNLILLLLLLLFPSNTVSGTARNAKLSAPTAGCSCALGCLLWFSFLVFFVCFFLPHKIIPSYVQSVRGSLSTPI